MSSLTDSFHLSISSSSNFPLQYFECTFLKHASQYSHLPRFTRGATPRPVSWPRSKVSKLDTCVIGELSQIDMFGIFCCEAFFVEQGVAFSLTGCNLGPHLCLLCPGQILCVRLLLSALQQAACSKHCSCLNWAEHFPFCYLRTSAIHHISTNQPYL